MTLKSKHTAVNLQHIRPNSAWWKPRYISLHPRFFDFFYARGELTKILQYFVLCFVPDVQGEAEVTVTLTCTVSSIVVSCEVADQGKPVWTGWTWLHQLWRSLEELQPNMKQILILLWDGTKVNGCNKKNKKWDSPIISLDPPVDLQRKKKRNLTKYLEII